MGRVYSPFQGSFYLGDLSLELCQEASTAPNLNSKDQNLHILHLDDYESHLSWLADLYCQIPTYVMFYFTMLLSVQLDVLT